MAITAALAGSKPRTLAECWKTVFYKPVFRRKLRCSQTIPGKCLSLGTVHAAPKASVPVSALRTPKASVPVNALSVERKASVPGGKRLSLCESAENVCPGAEKRLSLRTHAHVACATPQTIDYMFVAQWLQINDISVVMLLRFGEIRVSQVFL